MTGSTDRASTPVPPPADPAGDADGDGASNFVEFTAGTIPTSFASLSLPRFPWVLTAPPGYLFRAAMNPWESGIGSKPRRICTGG